MGSFFVYDRLIDEQDLCNHEGEIQGIFEQIRLGVCLRIFGRRNFGKTSIVKNVVAPKWEALSKENVVVYIDLYSIEDEEDISLETTKAFNLAMSHRAGIFEAGLGFLSALKNIRPTWTPATTPDGFGEFSIKTDDNKPLVPYRTVLETMGEIHRKGKIRFFLILDEFQEVGQVAKAEAKMRDALQNLPSDLPVAILGSKHHLLSRIFDSPKRPLHGWGNPVEIGAINYNAYTTYMRQRFNKADKNITDEGSKALQDMMDRVPEAINRFADFLAMDNNISEISEETVAQSAREFVDKSRSIYSEMFAGFSKKQRSVLIALAELGRVHEITGETFLRRVGNASKSGVKAIVEKLMDEAVVYREVDDNGDFIYCLNDPIFRLYLKYFKLL